MSTTVRVSFFCCCLLAGAGMLTFRSGLVSVPSRDSLATLPLEIGQWRGRALPRLGEEDRNMIRVDDYTNREYTDESGAAVGLYIGYHSAGGFHSPLNCLPAAGWTPVKKGYLDLSVNPFPGAKAEQSIHVNRIVILKGLDKQIALYWYQACGRVVASEYWGLLYGIMDKLQSGRTDAALVRILSPAQSLDPAAEERAAEHAADFAKAIFPLLGRYIPN